MNEAVIESHEIRAKLREKFSFLFDIRSLFYYVLLLIGICVAFFFGALATEQFTTPFGGDYSQQGYAFYFNAYDDWWTFFKTGKFPLYDTNTYLGADNIEANTFYGLFTPFLLFLLVFPRSFLPHAMVFMTIARLVCGALLFRLYLKKMGAKEATARLFSIAYAFMGWTTYYLWFATFLEVVAFLPLILLGVEQIIRDKKCWIVAVGFFCIGIGNYFFLLTFGIFGVIYAGFRFFQTFRERKAIDHLKVIGLGFAGFFFGICMCAIVTFPALFSSFKINRAETSKYLPNLIEAFKAKDFSTGFKMIFTYWEPYTVSNYHPAKWYNFCFSFPLVSYLFPAVSGRFVTIVHFNLFENVGSSIFIFTPCMLLMVPSLIRSAKNHKVSHFIALALILLCLFTPFIYWLSGAFSNSYGRWQVVVSTTLITYVALNFDHRDEFKKWQILLSGVLTILTMVGALLLANKLIALYAPSVKPTEYVGGNKWSYLISYDEIKAVVIYQFVIVVIESIVFFCISEPKYKRIQPIIAGVFIIIEAVVMGNAYINYHGLQSMEDDVNCGLYEFSVQNEIIQKLNEENKNTFYRLNSTKADEYHPNLGMAENYNGVSMFHSFYNTEVDDFVHMTALTDREGSWSGLNFAKHAYVNQFLGVKYFMTFDPDTSYIGGDGSTITYEPNIPLNYSLEKKINGYRVYKNDLQINFGFGLNKLYYKHRDPENKLHNAFIKGDYPWEDIIRNEETLFDGVILNDEDLNEVISQYDGFTAIDGVPKIKATSLGRKDGNIYISRDENSPLFNPAAPTSVIKPENLYEKDKDKDVDPTRFQIVIKLNDPVYPADSQGRYYLMDYPYASGNTRYDAAVWLIGEDDKVITYDDGRFNPITYNGGAIYRGFYSKKRVKYIIICPLNSGDGDITYWTERTGTSIFYQEWNDVLKAYNNAKKYELQNVTYNNGSATFTTNYEENRFVMTQLAYTKGWKLKANVNGVKQDVKVYNSQGGFVGFVAPKGTVTYELTYLTEGLVLWSLVTVGGFVGIVGVSVTSIIIKKRKQKRSQK